jgi:hypothetical protein
MHFYILDSLGLEIFDGFLAYFPHFLKNKSRLMKSPCCLCVYVFPYQLLHA